MERKPIPPNDNNHLSLKLDKNNGKNRYKLKESGYNIFDLVDFVGADIKPSFVMPLDRSEGGFSRKGFWDGKDICDDDSQLRFWPTHPNSGSIRFINGWTNQCKFKFTDKELNIIGNSIKKYFKEKYDIDFVVNIKTWKQFQKVSIYQ
jgi:hypothetical protein